MTHCFQCAPMCSPTRHNIYTGQYPIKTGAFPNHTFAYSMSKVSLIILNRLAIESHFQASGISVPKRFSSSSTAARKIQTSKSIDQLFRQCASTATPVLFVRVQQRTAYALEQG